MKRLLIGTPEGNADPKGRRRAGANPGFDGES